MYKCENCRIFIEDDLVSDLECPKCKGEIVPTCSMDKPDYKHQNVPGIKTCPECGQFVCPECGAHSVDVLSRVTGYLSPVDSWNSGKRQELVDRTRVSL